MIDRIVIDNFKSLRRVDLALGRMNLLVGENGSGKSNLLDGLRVLQGIGNGFTIHEIFDGKPKSATSAVWDGIRGGSRYACFADDGRGGSGDVTFDVRGRFGGGPVQAPAALEQREPGEEPARGWELLIAISPQSGCVTRERFAVDAVIYDTDHVEGFSETDPTRLVRCPVAGTGGWRFELQRTRPALGQLARGHWERGRGAAGSAGDASSQQGSQALRGHEDDARGVAGLLADIQRIAPALPRLRGYSQPGEVQRMGDRGEDFAALVRTICRDDRTKDAYLSWLRQLRPEAIEDVLELSGAVGEPLFGLQENGKPFPAAVLSDGTLRFAAMTAAFFQPSMPSVLMVEEIENGIHASRARLFLELLRSQSVAANTQVVATTHSATVLDWLEEADYRTTFLCSRDEETGASTVRALADVPQFANLVKKRPASGLFSEGWLEAAP